MLLLAKLQNMKQMPVMPQCVTARPKDYGVVGVGCGGVKWAGWRQGGWGGVG